MFITFDNYYTEEEYNHFIQAAKNNNIAFTEFISIRPPYYWYLEVETAPQFVNYEVATKADEKWLVSKIKALNPSEEYLLQRRTGSKTAIEKYISNTQFKRMRTDPYFLIFKNGGRGVPLQMSKEIPDEEIYVIGKVKGQYYHLTFNQYFKSFINENDVVLEKTSMNDFTLPGEVEQTLNYKKFVINKLKNKTLDLPYFKNGVYYPLKREIK